MNGDTKMKLSLMISAMFLIASALNIMILLAEMKESKNKNKES